MFLFSFLLLVSALSSFSKPVFAQGYVNVYVPQAKTMIDSNPSLVILDVRNQSEYDSGHIRNAKLIPVWNLTQRLNELNKSDSILVYCKAGTRSTQASEILVNNSFTNIYNMIGGITAWNQAGYTEYVKYSSIQAVINNATENSTIFVSTGFYNEHLVINKSITLAGENKYTTIIDGNNSGTIVDIASDNASLSGLTVQHPGCSCEGSYGIRLEDNHSGINLTDNELITDSVAINATWVQDVVIAYNDFSESYDHTMSIFNSSNILITHNNITGWDERVEIDNSSSIMFSNNILSGTMSPGVSAQGSSNNTFCGNSFLQDHLGILLEQSNNNRIYDNNFQGNLRDVSCHDSANAWDNSLEGNFWSNYTGIDANADGIGDTPYTIDANNTDNYPLMGSFAAYEPGYQEVDCISNSSVTGFSMEVVNSSQTTLAFNVTGQDGTQGFCRLFIPNVLINGPYTVRLDGKVISEPQFRILPESNANYTFVYLNYTHSQHTIEISGTTPIPESPSLTILMIFMSAMMLSTLFYKRRRPAAKKQTRA